MTIKTKQLALSLALLLTFFSSSVLKAQHQRYLVAKYMTNPASPLVADVLKTQVPDQQKYTEIMNQLSSHNYFFTLIYDLETNVSLYQLDSISSIPGINPGGNYEFVLKDKSDSLYGKEVFVGSEYYFVGNISELNWEITNETRKIGPYQTTKAISKNLRNCEVWFTTEIPVMSGPEVFAGLPGLVVQVESAFDTTNLQSVKFVPNDQGLLLGLKELKRETDNDKRISLKKVFESKSTTVTTMMNRTK